MCFCLTCFSFDTLGSVAVKAKAVFPSIITNVFGVNLFCNSIPLIVYFSALLFFSLNLTKQWIFSGAFSLWSSVGNEVLSQWRFRSHLEMQSVSSILCFSGREMEYLISLFNIRLFISCNERKFINIVFSIQKNDTYRDCFTYSIYILYLSHHSAIIHLSAERWNSCIELL